MNAETFGKLFSSNGTVVFRVSDGAVDRTLSEWDGDGLPARVDVKEWHSRYPGEDVAAGHDILDFGLWFGSVYFPPDAEFRKEWWIYGRQMRSDADDAAKRP